MFTKFVVTSDFMCQPRCRRECFFVKLGLHRAVGSEVGEGVFHGFGKFLFEFKLKNDNVTYKQTQK